MKFLDSLTCSAIILGVFTYATSVTCVSAIFNIPAFNWIRQPPISPGMWETAFPVKHSDFDYLLCLQLICCVYRSVLCGFFLLFNSILLLLFIYLFFHMIVFVEKNFI